MYRRLGFSISTSLLLFSSYTIADVFDSSFHNSSVKNHSHYQKHQLPVAKTTKNTEHYIPKATMPPVADQPVMRVGQNGWFVGFGFGTHWPETANTSFRRPYTPLSFFDSYNIDKYDNGYSLRADAGYHWLSARKFPTAYYLGLRYQFGFENTMNGTLLILNRNQPGFAYHFSADLSMQILMLFGKIELANFYGFSPYILVGAGFSDTTFADYKESPKDSNVTPRDSAAFERSSVFNFAYAAGAGVDYHINSHWLVSAAYEYGFYGQAKSGPGAVNAFNGNKVAFNFGDLSANSLWFTVHYLFNA